MSDYSRYRSDAAHTTRYQTAGAGASTSTTRVSAGSKFNRLRLIVVVGFFAFISLSGYGLWAQHASAEAAASRASQLLALHQAQARSTLFQKQVAVIMGDNPADNISVAVHSDLLGAQYFGTPGDYDGASTGKLITAADYLHHVDEGSASLKQQIDGQSAQSLLQAMIVNSDDTAWATLNDYLTHADLSTYASTIGLSNYDPTTNNFSAGDIADLLYKLQSGQLIKPAGQQLLLGYMKVANYREYMIPAIPAGYTAYHKVGLDNDNVHDAAIISHGGNSIELVIFTNGNGTYDWPDRALMMQQITKDALAAYLTN
jgi:beta-lactamase class A